MNRTFEKTRTFSRTELPKYCKNVLLVYGGGSIKKSGIYDKVVEILKAKFILRKQATVKEVPLRANV